MAQQFDDSTEERLGRLEEEVAELRRVMTELLKSRLAGQAQEKSPQSAAESASRQEGVAARSTTSEPATIPAPGLASSPQRVAGPQSPKSSAGFDSEVWFNRVGIGLLLFGVAFLFKYSIDQGWLTPWVRVAAGLILGLFLLYFGASKYRDRRHFGQILLGGGIATLYITGFAAFQLFELIPHLVAFVYMILVTVTAFFLAVQQSRVLLAVIGVLGGLLTPFLLHTGTGNLPGLLFYTVVICSGSGAIYLIRRWRLLLWVTFAGFWLVCLAGILNGFGGAGERLFNKWSIQISILYALVMFGGLAAISPLNIPAVGRWQRLFGGEALTEALRASNPWQLNTMMIAAPLLSKSFSLFIWTMQEETWGLIAIGFSLLYAAIAKLVWPLKNGDKVGYVHLLIATLLLTLGICLVLEGNALLVTLAAEGTIMHFLAKRFDDRGTGIRAHFLFLATLIWLTYRLFDHHPGTAFFTIDAITDLAVIGSFYLASLALKAEEVLPYRGIAHLLFMGWIARELSAFDNGLALTSIVWGLYGVALLLSGMKLKQAVLRNAGFLTLLVVVGKLIFVDLTNVAAIWRILLFMGFGGAFLSLGYFFPNLWQTDNDEDKDIQNENKG